MVQEVVQLLLAYGADANCRDDSNQTPLHLASRAGHVGLVKLLDESSAKIDVRNNEERQEERMTDLGPPENADAHYARLPGSFPTSPQTFMDTPPSDEMFWFCHIL